MFLARRNLFQDRLRLALSITMLAVLVLTACIGGNNSATDQSGNAAGGTQKNEGGAVTVAVTWDGPASGPVFLVALDTHSVDLDGYDLRELATLRTDKGLELRPAGWDAPKGGHHRSGRLTFPDRGADGAPAFGPDTKGMTLIVRDVAGVPERRFQWTW
jgi:hypothetical protein